MAKVSSHGVLMVMIAAILALPLVAGANSMAVTAAAAMGNSTGTACSGSPCGLEITLDDPASVASTEVYVGTGNGPTDGFNDETAIDIEFWIDPSGMTMPATGNIRVLRLFQNFVPPRGLNVVFFLQRNQLDTGWHIHVWHLEDAGPYLYAGGGFLTSAAVGSNMRTKVNLEWIRASAPGANDGEIRVWRTADLPGASKLLIFEKTDIDNDTQSVDIMHLGMVNKGSHNAGEFGTLYLDEVVVTRM